MYPHITLDAWIIAYSVQGNQIFCNLNKCCIHPFSRFINEMVDLDFDTIGFAQNINLNFNLVQDFGCLAVL